MSEKATGRDSDKFMLRLPDGMRDELKRAAARNSRSLNAEIISRLERTLSPPLNDAWMKGYVAGFIETMLKEGWSPPAKLRPRSTLQGDGKAGDDDE